MTTTTKPCARCGTSFAVTARHPHQSFCSPECRYQAKLEGRKVQRAGGALAVRKAKPPATKLRPEEIVMTTQEAAELEMQLAAIRDELRAAGKPLVRYDTQGYQEKPRRELMAGGRP